MLGIEIRILDEIDAKVLENVAADVFDGPVNARWTEAFLSDQRHHLAVALDDDNVIGFASAVENFHPDKPPSLFINEVGVAPTHQGKGLGKRLLNILLARGRELGCQEAWVATEPDNAAARKLYESVGGKESEQPFVMYTFPIQSADES